MNENNLPSLLYLIAILLSVARSTKQLRTFLYSMAANFIAGFAVLLLLFFFLPAHSARALGPLVGDIGRMAGIITAFFYSTKTRERAPRSVYLVAFSCRIILLVGLALGNF